MEAQINPILESLKKNTMDVLSQSTDKRVIMQSILLDGTNIFRRGGATVPEIEKIAAKALALLVLLKQQ